MAAAQAAGAARPGGGAELQPGYPELAALAGDALEGRLGPDPRANVAVIRAAFAAALAEVPVKTEVDELRVRLLEASVDADHVLDLHCDHRAVMHLYASTARPEVTDLLARCTGRCWR